MTPSHAAIAAALADPEGGADVLRWSCATDPAIFAAVALGEQAEHAFSRMHLDFLSRPRRSWRERTTPERWADAAPRGHAKSTLESYVSVAHDICMGREVFVVILSTTYSLAEQLVRRLWSTFSREVFAPDLHALFGPFEVSGGMTDFIVTSPATGPRGVRVVAMSFGGEIRGQSHAGYRPSKVLIDDGESLKETRSAGRRVNTWEYLTKDVLKAGYSYTVYRAVGTILHPDSMLSRLLASPGWRGSRYRALESWPERTDLWEQCRAIWSDLDNDERLDASRVYYHENRVEMDRGARLLWPDGDPLFDLMESIWADGMPAFLSEKQNEPRDPARQIFDVDGFARCTFDGEHIVNNRGRRVPIGACDVAVWLDPIPPKDGYQRGDYAALAVVARDPSGYRYVLRCDLEREPPDRTRARVWSLFDAFPKARFAYESNGFAALSGEGFEREARDRETQGRPSVLHVRGVVSTENKEARIARLQPDTVAGFVQFDRGLSAEVLAQFRDFPGGAHDDGPDAIERADWRLTSTPAVQRGGWG